jgi:malate dehydrogenase
MIAATGGGQARRLPPERFTAMVRLDQNRATIQLAKKSRQPVTAVSDIYIFGNHSPSMFPAFHLAKINGTPVPQAIPDAAWLQTTFCDTVGKRGAAIIAARGSSSAASGANALIDHVRDLSTPGIIHSIAVKSNAAYGFDPNVWAGLPVRTNAPGSYEIIKNLPMDDFAKQKLAATNKELLDERETIKSML